MGNGRKTPSMRFKGGGWPFAPRRTDSSPLNRNILRKTALAFCKGDGMEKRVSLPAFGGGNNDRSPAAERDVFRHFLYCSKVVRLI